MIRKCIICSKEFKVYPYQVRRGVGKTCSISCGNISKKSFRPTKEMKRRIRTKLLGTIPWNKGKKCKYMSELNKRLTGEKSRGWKGNDVGYGGIHDWVRKKFGTPGDCSLCRRSGLVGKKIHWHNISGNYNRDRQDWARLCASCHLLHDRYEKEDVIAWLDKLVK